jgi:hypothetical protein
MKKIFFTVSVLVLVSTGALAQYNTDCTRDYFGNFSCSTKPSDMGFIDFGGFQRGAQQANQERQQQELMWQQLQMQQQMLEQQKQMRLQQERLNAINEERNVPEWQLGELFRLDAGKGVGGSLRCVYRTRQGFVFVKGTRYGEFYQDVPITQNCSAQLQISKLTGQSK